MHCILSSTFPFKIKEDTYKKVSRNFILSEFHCRRHISFLRYNVALNTVKPVNKGHRKERQHMVIIDKWSLLEVVFIRRWPLIQVWQY